MFAPERLLLPVTSFPVVSMTISPVTERAPAWLRVPLVTVSVPVTDAVDPRLTAFARALLLTVRL